MSIYSEISANKTKTYLIMAFFVVFVTAVVYVLAIALGLPTDYWWLALIVTVGMSLGSYFYSDSMVLAISGAKELKNTPGQNIFDIVQNLSIASGLPMPKVYLIEDSAPNAFATGRDPAHASVCVTSGLLQMMNKTELEGVIAHELSHVKNYDTRLMVIVCILVGGVSILANFFLRSLFWRGRDNDRNQGGAILLVIGLVFAILSPIIVTLIQLAISRQREFLADASGALLTRYPAGLANALEKLSRYQSPDPKFATDATAHLFIVNPFGKKSRDFLAGLLQTHPPIEERIKILRSM